MGVQLPVSQTELCLLSCCPSCVLLPELTQGASGQVPLSFVLGLQLSPSPAGYASSPTPNWDKWQVSQTRLFVCLPDQTS